MDSTPHCSRSVLGWGTTREQCGVESIFVVVVSIVLFGVLLLVFTFVGLCYDVVDRDHVRMSHDGAEVQTSRQWMCTQEPKKSDTFSICACHPCAGAMLIFSVSFQFYRMRRF
jgi:hypothetical protein